MNFCFHLFYRFLYLFLIFISFIDFYFLQNISMNWILFNYWILSSFWTFFLSIFIVVIFMLILHIWIPTQGSTTHDNVFTGGGRSEVIRMKQPGPGTWTWIGKSDPVMGRSPYSGTIDISSSSIWTSRPNITIVMSSPPVWPSDDTCTHGHRIMDWALS